jgi:hypothetical protein
LYLASVVDPVHCKLFVVRLLTYIQTQSALSDV